MVAELAIHPVVVFQVAVVWLEQNTICPGGHSHFFRAIVNITVCVVFESGIEI